MTNLTPCGRWYREVNILHLSTSTHTQRTREVKNSFNENSGGMNKAYCGNMAALENLNARVSKNRKLWQYVTGNSLSET